MVGYSRWYCIVCYGMVVSTVVGLMVMMRAIDLSGHRSINIPHVDISIGTRPWPSGLFNGENCYKDFFLSFLNSFSWILIIWWHRELVARIIDVWSIRHTIGKYVQPLLWHDWYIYWWSGFHSSPFSDIFHIVQAKSECWWSVLQNDCENGSYDQF